MLLPLTVLSVTVTEPPKIPPPREAGPAVLLPLTVLFVTVTEPPEIPPP